MRRAARSRSQVWSEKAGPGPVRRALRGNAEPRFAGEADRGGDVGLALRYRDQRRLRVEREVEAEAGVVPAGVPRREQLAVEQLAEVDDLALLRRHHGNLPGPARITRQARMAGLSTASPLPISTSLTIAGGNSPCAATPGSASRRAASSAGFPIAPR